MASSIPDRVRYRERIENLIDEFQAAAGVDISEIEMRAHWAKYICILVSGYLEQSVKEIVMEYADKVSVPRIRKYVLKTWADSRNMRFQAIQEILDNLDEKWAAEFDQWLQQKDERKKEINEIIAWRNYIAHGKEFNAHNVTLVSVKTKFIIACDLVNFLDDLVLT